MLSIATTVSVGTSSDYENVAFAPEEIATLGSLMERYDQVILDLDSLNDRLQELLGIEIPPPPKCGSPV
ncbi:MAG TPA: hypothetical protein VM260_22840 [Pirellula sp.]|nr:hypothetical protein [Pirellula sp.]